MESDDTGQRKQAERLSQLTELHRQGVLSDDVYEAAAARLVGEPTEEGKRTAERSPKGGATNEGAEGGVKEQMGAATDARPLRFDRAIAYLSLALAATFLGSFLGFFALNLQYPAFVLGIIPQEWVLLALALVWGLATFVYWYSPERAFIAVLGATTLVLIPPIRNIAPGLPSVLPSVTPGLVAAALALFPWDRRS